MLVVPLRPILVRRLPLLHLLHLPLRGCPAAACTAFSVHIHIGNARETKKNAKNKEAIKQVPVHLLHLPNRHQTRHGAVHPVGKKRPTTFI